MKNIFFIVLIIVLLLTGCNNSNITEDTVYLNFPLEISLEKIPKGWTLDEHFGYALHNSNVKRIIMNDVIIKGNFDLTIVTNEPIKAKQQVITITGASLKVDPLIASNIFEKLLEQNIPMYEVSCGEEIRWIDLKNDVKYFFSSKDSLLLITDLVAFNSDPKNRRNRLKERLLKNN